MPKFTEYPAVTVPADSDIFVVNRGGITKQETGAQVRQGMVPTSDPRLTDSRPITVRKNTGANVGTRKKLDFIEGSNVTLTVTDDSAADEVDITIASTGGGGSVPDATTTVKGIVELATDGEVAASLAVQANDARLSDSRTVEIAKNGTLVGTRKRINLIEGSNATITVADNSGAGRVDVTIAAASGGGGSTDPLSVLELRDDFSVFAGEAGEVGSLGWTYVNGTATHVASVANHPGVVRLSSNAAVGALMRLVISSTTVGVYVPADLDNFYFILHPIDLTNIKLRIGLMADLTNNQGGSDGIQFIFDPANNANWITRTRAASTNTDTTSTVAVSATWFFLKATRNGSGNIEFSINNTLVATHTTNVPTAAMNFGITVEAGENLAKICDLDLVYLKTKALGQRWT